MQAKPALLAKKPRFDSFEQVDNSAPPPQSQIQLPSTSQMQAAPDVPVWTSKKDQEPRVFNGSDRTSNTMMSRATRTTCPLTSSGTSTLGLLDRFSFGSERSSFMDTASVCASNISSRNGSSSDGSWPEETPTRSLGVSLTSLPATLPPPPLSSMPSSLAQRNRNHPDSTLMGTSHNSI